jgi:hypothetical protein
MTSSMVFPLDQYVKQNSDAASSSTPYHQASWRWLLHAHLSSLVNVMLVDIAHPLRTAIHHSIVPRCNELISGAH